MEKQYLLIIDVPGIKDYVFGTDRLVEIRGASGLLDKLNRKETERFLKDKLGDAAVECVFSNGGAGQFVITAEKTDLENCICELKGFFAKASKGALRLLCGTAEFSEENYSQASDQARAELKKEKEEESILPCTQLHTGYVHECKSCSGMGSQIIDEHGEKRILCKVCAEKAEYGKKRGLWKEFAEYFEDKGVFNLEALFSECLKDYADIDPEDDYNKIRERKILEKKIEKASQTDNPIPKDWIEG